jgi:hypothetical protein
MRREGCNALLRTSTVTLPAPALRPAPPSTVTPRCPFSCSTVPPRCFLPLLFALRPALPDGVGTATLMRGDLAWKPSGLASCYGCGTRCRWRRRPHGDTMHVASIHFKYFRGICCKYFIRILQSRLRYCTCCNELYMHFSSVCSKCFICFTYVASILFGCCKTRSGCCIYICKCLRCICLQWLRTCFQVFSGVLQVF